MRTRLLTLLAALCAAALALAAVAAAGGGHGPAAHGGKAAKPSRAVFAVLSGSNEIGTGNRRGAGDRDGRGSFTATVGGGQLCFGITVASLDTPVAAHIHKARPNRNGDIVVPLTAPSSGDRGASSGCVTVSAAIGRAILRHPHDYYANVHTIAFPAGAIRGQLFGRR